MWVKLQLSSQVITTLGLFDYISWRIDNEAKWASGNFANNGGNKMAEIIMMMVNTMVLVLCRYLKYFCITGCTSLWNDIMTKFRLHHHLYHLAFRSLLILLTQILMLWHTRPSVLKTCEPSLYVQMVHTAWSFSLNNVWKDCWYVRWSVSHIYTLSNNSIPMKMRHALQIFRVSPQN